MQYVLTIKNKFCGSTIPSCEAVYNDKSEIGEVPKLLNGLLDYQYLPLGRTDIPRQLKQDNLCRAQFLDNFLDNSLLKL
jgi:hypothetical protein